MKEILKKFVPKWALSFYHLCLAELGALLYGYPAKKMIVIGITGTKGKSSTAYLTAKLLESTGAKVGLTSTIIFKIGEREWLNDKKMTMLGRFALQKFLRQMARDGCKYAVIETSSEGIFQWRHIGICYDLAVFTNLSPEHIESHGSYNKYKEAKAKLFKGLSCSKNKNISKISIINLDDDEADYFLKLHDKNVGFTLKNSFREGLREIISVKNIDIDDKGSKFIINGVNFSTALLGRFNIYNITAALTVGKILGFELESFKEKIKEIIQVPGRMEFINLGQDFKVIVDYAHEPVSMKALYGIVRNIEHKKIIHIFGATGGGRDKSKRLILGEIADQNADLIILTNDDPYTENQEKIISDIQKGISVKRKPEQLLKIIDRGDAIRIGIKLAQKDDIVLITGKGSEQVIVIGNEKLPWDDRKIAQNAIKSKIKN